jgi:hypothetical protein
MTVVGAAQPQGGQPAAVFYSFGHPAPYAYVEMKQGGGVTMVTPKKLQSKMSIHLQLAAKGLS